MASWREAILQVFYQVQKKVANLLGPPSCPARTRSRLDADAQGDEDSSGRDHNDTRVATSKLKVIKEL